MRLYQVGAAYRGRIQNVMMIGDINHLMKMTKSMSTYCPTQSPTEVTRPWVKLMNLSCSAMGSAINLLWVEIIQAVTFLAYSSL